MSTAGHNSLDTDRLTSFVERIERLAGEKATIQEDIKAVYAESKAAGFDSKAMRGVIAARKRERQEFEDYIAQFNLYMRALGGPEVGDL
jgi:uncharacterized protein (UPF0335 family)